MPGLPSAQLVPSSQQSTPDTDGDGLLDCWPNVLGSSATPAGMEGMPLVSVRIAAPPAFGICWMAETGDWSATGMGVTSRSLTTVGVPRVMTDGTWFVQPTNRLTPAMPMPPRKTLPHPEAMAVAPAGFEGE